MSKLSNDTFTYKTKPNPGNEPNKEGKEGKGLNAHPHVTKIYKTLTLIACGVVFGLHETKIQAAEKKRTSTRRKGGNTIRITGTLEWVQA